MKRSCCYFQSSQSFLSSFYNVEHSFLRSNKSSGVLYCFSNVSGNNSSNFLVPFTRSYARSGNFEPFQRPPSFDWLPLRKKIWPETPEKPVDYRSYVPPDDNDEDPSLLPPQMDHEEDLGDLDAGDEGAGFPVITPKAFQVKKVPKLNDKSKICFLGIGRRKSSRARVELEPGDGTITVNNRSLSSYFPSLIYRDTIISPFVVIERLGCFNVDAYVRGGGVTGQAEAIRLGIARALQSYDLAYRPVLKAAGYLKRDPRVVERKKIGFVKARKRPQWSKR